jgi:tRNA (adenine22-N1)-methyltransferase
MKINLKPRQLDLFNMIGDQYKEVWDTCCDHGLLGSALLDHDKTKKVHFVDQVPRIINLLKSRIESYKKYDSNSFEIHLESAENLKLDKNSLFCITGVGGEVVIKIISGLLKNNDLTNHDLLICSQNKNFEIRNYLKENNFRLKREQLSYEGSWCYEMMLVSLNGDFDVDPIGAGLFDLKEARQITYLKKLILHYNNRSLNDKKSDKIALLYQNILN